LNVVPLGFYSGGRIWWSRELAGRSTFDGPRPVEAFDRLFHDGGSIIPVSSGQQRLHHTLQKARHDLAMAPEEHNNFIASSQLQTVRSKTLFSDSQSMATAELPSLDFACLAER